MVGEEDEGVDLDGVLALGAGENAEGDGPELLAGSQEEPPVDGPAGDLDEGSPFGDEPDASAHAAGWRSRGMPAAGLCRRRAQKTEGTGVGGF